MATPEGKPKVFISYCWDNYETKERVFALADFLDANFVHVEMDRYQPEGSNLYKFMEQMVNDPSIDKVLVFVDQAYLEKANSGAGGVGTETTILTPEVYHEAAKGDSNHVKFVPILFEVPVDKNRPMPTMFGTAKYSYMVDPTKDEAHGLQLLNICFGRAEYTRSQTAVKPAHLTDGGAGFDQTASGLAVLTRTQAKQEKERLALVSFETYLDAVAGVFESFTLPGSMSSYYGDRHGTLEGLITPRLALLPEYLGVIEDLLKFTGSTLMGPLHTFFGRMMNVCFGHGDRPVKDLARMFARELFVLTLVAFVRRRRYAEIHDFLDHPFRIRDHSWREYSYFSYGPEDDHDETWQRARSAVAWAAAGVTEGEGAQAELLLLLWGKVSSAREINWSFANTHIWSRTDFRPALFWDVHSRKTVQPLIDIFGQTPAQILERLSTVEKVSPDRRISIGYVTNLDAIRSLNFQLLDD